MNRARFARVGFVALVTMAVALPIVLDQNRAWKSIQREALERRRAELLEHLDAVTEATADDVRFHEESVDVARDAQAEHAEEIAEIERERFRLARQLRAAEERLERARDPDARLEARIEVESYREMLADRDARLDLFRSDLREAETALAETRRPWRELATRLEEVERGRTWRRWPIVGDWAPSLRVREIEPDQLAGGRSRPRIERCVTCHVGMLDAFRPVDGREASPEDTEDEAWQRAVFAPHPRTGDLFGPGSPHPFESIGCTVCHGGDGRATDFVRAGHRPATEDEDEDDTARRREPTTEPILAGSLAEAGCATCHGDSAWIEGAPLQAAGRRLAAEIGCAGCHRTGRRALDTLPAAGPSLAALEHKISAEALRARLADSSDRYWRTWGHGAPEDLEPIVREAILATLYDAAPDSEPLERTVGDPASGGALFASRGCRACHRLDEEIDLAEPERLRGPDLAGLGARATPAWVRAWLLDPRSLRPDTLMPDLRLDEAEAADLAAFLTAGDGSGSLDAASLDPVALDPVALETLATEALRRDGTVEAAAARIAAADLDQRLRIVGEDALRRHGCAGCHVLPAGLDIAPPDGGDLSAVGPRLARRLAPDLAPENVPADWIHADSRRADAPRGPLVPEPETADDAARALLAQVLGWRPNPLARPPRDPGAAGRVAMERHGCRACHSLAGSTGLGSMVENGPPALDAAGARLRSQWLVHYLRDPSSESIRPWIEVPMPTFDLDAAEIDAILGTLVARSGVPRVAEPMAAGLETPTSRTLARAVGQAVYGMLQCGRCHLGYDDPGGVSVPEPAPDYAPARRRLRPEWVEAFLLDPPAALAPSPSESTSMPRIFPLGEDGRPESDFLVAALDAPMFQVQQARLRRLFASEAELHAYLSDPETVARALRAHVFTLEEDP